jgi:hypothetical protein
VDIGWQAPAAIVHERLQRSSASHCSAMARF